MRRERSEKYQHKKSVFIGDVCTGEGCTSSVGPPIKNISLLIPPLYKITVHGPKPS